MRSMSTKIVSKQVSGAFDSVSGDRYKFIMSTPSVDRMGDIVEQNWDLSTFNKSPVALYGHDHSLVVGRWHNVRVERGQLVGEVEFADESVDTFAAKIGRMVKAGFIRACSVGFRPLEATPIKTGMKFLKNELLECSLVAVGANQDALAFAKSFCSDREISRLFAASTGSDLKVRQARARHLKNLSNYLE